MKTPSIKQLLFTICLSATVVAVSAQNPVLMGKESLVKISGTSNLHDWHEIAEDFTIEMSLAADGSASPVINKVILTCKAASIMSDNSIMTNKTHEALRVENHPEITFNSDHESVLQVRNGGFSSTIAGQLTINGIKNQVTVPVEGTLTGTKLTVKGVKSIKMSDYGIKAPTALMGTLKTGDVVTVSFDLKFEVPSNNVIITALNN